MKLQELVEMSVAQIQNVETQLIRDYRSIGIDLVFSTHFNDRIVDGAVDDRGTKRDNITEQDLMGVFDKLRQHHKEVFADAANFQDEVRRGTYQGVIRESLRKINVPFILAFNRYRGCFTLTCKTIMKKAQFHAKPSDHVVDI